MSRVELDPDQAIRLFQNASMGRLIGGLIHNLNGPLHALGMEMDVMGFLLNKKPPQDHDLAKDFANRLARMGEEFEKLNLMIRQTADRADLLSSSSPMSFNLNHLLREELEFLKSNLYFKHRVEVTMELDEGIKNISPRSNYLCLGLRLLFQILVEDLEANEIHSFFLKTAAGPDDVDLIMQTQGGSLSNEILDSMKYEGDLPLITAKELPELERLMIVELLKASGVRIGYYSTSEQSEIRLTLPYE